MKIVAINALNSNSGGGKSIRDSYLKLLNSMTLKERYVVIVADGVDIDFIDNPKIEILYMPSYWAISLLAPFIYRFSFNQLFRRIGVDLVLNLGDLIIHSGAKQIYIFDWSYALDVHPRIWKEMRLPDWINRKLKLSLIKHEFRKPDIIVVQTNHIRNRLIELYGLNDVRIVSGAGTLDNPRADEPLAISLPNGIRLVYPAVYYPHKNLEILIELAKLIEENDLDYKIITTVNPISKASRGFVESVESQHLQNVVVNIGQIPLTQMQDLYRKCDALLMPTLLESFGLVYLEAMSYGLPIFTSNMWFSRDVCGPAATYFDALDANDILKALNRVMRDYELKEELIQKGKERLSSFSSWEENFCKYQSYIDELLLE